MTQSSMIQLQDEFKQAARVLEKIEQAGYQAYFVGGSVRDALLGLAIDDIDIASSAYPAEIKAIFPKTVDVGIEHGTVLVLDGKQSYEVTSFRTESQYADYRRPDRVEFVRSLEEDLKRRDFTINALALDAEGQLIDLFHGLDDLKRGVIRAVGRAEERFHEDALRMMRAIRFQSQLDFDIEDQTFQALKKYGHLLSKIAVERIHVEFIKLMKGQAKSKGLTSFIESQAYRYCPAMADHKEGLVQLKNFPLQLDQEEGIWALIGYYFNLTAIQLKQMLKAWKSSNQMIDQALAIKKALTFRLEQDWTDDVLYQLGLEPCLQAEYLASALGQEPDYGKLKQQWQSLAIYSKQELAINGSKILDLLDKPAGPWLGQLLEQIESDVVNGQLRNEESALIQYVKNKQK